MDTLTKSLRPRLWDKKPKLRIKSEKHKDLTGLVFGFLTVLKRVPSTTYQRSAVVWLCRCKCGAETIARPSQLQNGVKKSCANRCFHKYSTCAKPKPWTRSDAEASFRCCYLGYKGGAKKRGLAFELSEEVFRMVTQQRCTYCNALPTHPYLSTRSVADPYVCNGLDRVDSNKGYVPDNVVACCRLCNTFKSAHSSAAFLWHVQQIYKHCFVETSKGAEAIKEDTTPAPTARTGARRKTPLATYAQLKEAVEALKAKRLYPSIPQVNQLLGRKERVSMTREERAWLRALVEEVGTFLDSPISIPDDDSKSSVGTLNPMQRHAG